MMILFPSQQVLPDHIHVEGYAAIFNRRDMSGDTIRPGAFGIGKKLILTDSPRVMMLYQHAAEAPIGKWTRLEEDEYGLFVQGNLYTDTRQGRDLYHLLRGGAIDGLSIGFKPTRSRRMADGGRELLRVQLWEVSIVSFPMVPGARITRLRDPAQRSPQNLLAAKG